MKIELTENQRSVLEELIEDRLEEVDYMLVDAPGMSVGPLIQLEKDLQTILEAIKNGSSH